MTSNLLSEINALLITNPTNIRYLTGFVGASPEEREAFALLLRNQLFLFTNSLYLEAARKLSNSPIIQFSNNPIQTIEISREEPFAKKLAEVLTGSRLVKCLGFEETDLTVAELARLKKELKGITLVPTRDRIEELRMIKREDEIGNIKAAAKLTDLCFDFILGKLKPEVTEADIAWEIESFIRRRGAQLAFSPIVAFGKNTSQPHYTQCQMSNVKCQMNDILLLDFGAKVNGYCSDMTRVVFIGHPDEEWQSAYRVVLRAQKSALNTILRCIDTSKRTNKSLNISGALLDRTARKEIIQMGFPPYPHSLGHGVGLDIHEAPRLTIKKDEPLRPGMVVTIEPAVYVEGSFGVRIENLVLISQKGIEILSSSTKHIPVL